MRKVKRLLRRDTGTWALSVLTVAIAAFSLWTSNYLYKTRGQQLSGPASADVPPPSRCTLSFTISELPPCKNIDVVGMSIDRSSSMNAYVTGTTRRKVEFAREAADKFFQTLIDAKNAGVATNVRASLNSFGAQSTTGGVLGSQYNSKLHQALTTDIPLVKSKVGLVQYSVPGTCIECGLDIANGQVQQSAQTEKVVILLSDGKANHNPDGTTANAKANAIAEAERGRTQLGVQYHVLAHGDVDATTLRAIAGTTGSYTYEQDATQWSNRMLEILTKICTGPTPTQFRTPTPTRAGTPTPTRSSTPTPTRVVSTTPIVSTPPNTQISPTGDAYVSSSSPSTNYGSASTLRVDGASPVNITYMKFDLTSLAGRTISKAYLRLYVTNRTAGTLNIKRLTSDWFENSVTYNNRPSLGSLIRTFTAPSTAGTWVSVELTTFVNNNKGNPVTFAIDTTSSDDFVFNARGASTNKPYILIQ